MKQITVIIIVLLIPTYLVQAQLISGIQFSQDYANRIGILDINNSYWENGSWMIGYDLVRSSNTQISAWFDTGKDLIHEQNIKAFLDVIYAGGDARFKNKLLIAMNLNQKDDLIPGGWGSFWSGSRVSEVFSEVDSATMIPGTFRRLTLGAGQWGIFDFLLHSPGDPNATSALAGGVWRMIHPHENSPTPSDGFEYGAVYHGDTADLGVLMAFEETNVNIGYSDRDKNDFVFSLRYAGSVIPEPTLFGIIGACALLGLIIQRKVTSWKLSR